MYIHIVSLLKTIFYLSPLTSQHYYSFPAQSEIKEFLANEELRNGENLTAFYLKEVEKKENNNFNSKNLSIVDG